MNSKNNPVLSQFRTYGDVEFPEPWVSALDCLFAFGGYTDWNHPKSYFYVLTTATDAEVIHARKVLHRLANFTSTR